MLAAINRDNYEDHPRNDKARTKKSPRIREVYITQRSDYIEGRVTK